jgi:hypothetical protein
VTGRGGGIDEQRHAAIGARLRGLGDRLYGRDLVIGGLQAGSVRPGCKAAANSARSARPSRSTPVTVTSVPDRRVSQSAALSTLECSTALVTR